MKAYLERIPIDYYTIEIYTFYTCRDNAQYTDTTEAMVSYCMVGFSIYVALLSLKSLMRYIDGLR